VSPGAVYRHFRDKEDLLTALAEQGLELLLGWVAHYQADLDPSDHLGHFRAFGVANLRFCFEHPVHFSLLNNPTYARGDRSPAIAAKIAAAEGFVGELLEQGAESCQMLEPARARLAADAMTYGLCRMYVDGHLPGVQTHEQLLRIADRAFEVLGTGLIPRRD
jgi:AcrR family transcriptional regulator